MEDESLCPRKIKYVTSTILTDTVLKRFSSLLDTTVIRKNGVAVAWWLTGCMEHGDAFFSNSTAGRI